MKRKRLILFTLSVALIAIGFVLGTFANDNSNNARAETASPPTASELLILVNAERNKNGVAPLVEDPRLDASAQFKASDMNQRHYFGHEDPVTGAKNGLDVANSLDKDCVWVSENLVENIDSATGATLDNTSKGTVAAWNISPAHHTAMVDQKYSTTGFGISGNYVVEHFCQK